MLRVGVVSTSPLYHRRASSSAQRNMYWTISGRNDVAEVASVHVYGKRVHLLSFMLLLACCVAACRLSRNHRPSVGGTIENVCQFIRPGLLFPAEQKDGTCNFRALLFHVVQVTTVIVNLST